MPVVIRQARADDVATLDRLIPESVRGLSGGYYAAEQIESAIVHVFGVDTQLIRDGTYFVAEIDRELVGCGGWSRRRTLYGGDQTKSGEDEEYLDPATEAARIRAFFVHPGWARRGIGSALMRTCEAAARAAGFTRLELMATLPGEPLYAALGFVMVEQVDVEMPGGHVLPLRRMVKNVATG
jgi:predicted N-acetyltransferase YhbS